MSNLQEDLEVNFMPFSINYSGPAPISKFMQVSDCDGKLSSHFRGREIKGEVIVLPDTLCGVLVSKPRASDNAVHILGSFKEVKLWEHDVAPNRAMISDMFDWADIAQSANKI